MGYIQVLDLQGKLLWQKKIYKVRYKAGLEKDVQDIFIKGLTLKNDRLIIHNEKDQWFSLDLKKKKVKTIKQPKPGTASSATR